MTTTIPSVLAVDGTPQAVVPTISVNELGQYADLESRNSVFSAYAKQGIAATTYAVLVDLNDTAHWPHSGTNYLDLFKVYMTVDRASNTHGTLRVGVITRVDATSADVTFFNRLDFDNSSDAHLTRDRSFSPSTLSMKQSGGMVSRFVSTGRVTGLTAINTATPMESYLGPASVVPAVGDVIIGFEYASGGAYSATVSCFYMGWPPA